MPCEGNSGTYGLYNQLEMKMRSWPHLFILLIVKPVKLAFIKKYVIKRPLLIYLKKFITVSVRISSATQQSYHPNRQADGKRNGFCTGAVYLGENTARKTIMRERTFSA